MDKHVFLYLGYDSISLAKEPIMNYTDFFAKDEKTKSEFLFNISSRI